MNKLIESNPKLQVRQDAISTRLNALKTRVNGAIPLEVIKGMFDRPGVMILSAIKY